MTAGDFMQMQMDNVGPITMTLSEKEGDFQSCEHGHHNGQALCAFDLDEFFAVRKAEVIKVIPCKRPGKTRVKIEESGWNRLKIDGESWTLYRRTVNVANHWIYKGYNYVEIEILA